MSENTARFWCLLLAVAAAAILWLSLERAVVNVWELGGDQAEAHSVVIDQGEMRAEFQAALLQARLQARLQAEDHEHVEGYVPSCHEDQNWDTVPYWTEGAVEDIHGVSRLCVQHDEDGGS